jgi:NAD(P)-dependent dehydrogenase (short-subunit alcohol dehydrogenase family)
MTIRFENRVAIDTGAGTGLGRSHALALAARGARVLVNDVGASVRGEGQSSDAAQAVVAEIEAAGGVAMADATNVTDAEAVAAMVKRVLAAWGRVDILVNNAGILRDRTFANMDLDDFRAVLDVHLMGSVHCTKAVWEPMRERKYGRVVFTTSSSGLYGNFGQANYATAKAGLVGLMNVLHLEGAKYGIRVNALSPVAATRMTEQNVPPAAARLVQPQEVTPGLVFLVSEDAPSGVILTAGAGSFARAMTYETEGIYLAPDERTPETIAERFADISDPEGQRVMGSANVQTTKYVVRAMSENGRSAKPRAS